jgi:hypothetical protein
MEQFENYNSEELEESFFADFRRLSRIFSQAKSERSALEQYRKTLRSRIMVEASERGVKSYQNQLRDAEADPRYEQIIYAYEAAVLKESGAYMELELLRLKFEKWRTLRADERAAMNMR